MEQEQYERWRAKANQIVLHQDAVLPDDVATYFDKFFTLYVAFNMLYAEATFRLADRPLPNNMAAVIAKRARDNKGFPDAEGATSYLVCFLGAKTITDAIDRDTTAREALDTIKAQIQAAEFHIKLDPLTGNQQDAEDLDLLGRLRGNDTNARATAILEVIYSVRCNMFHGRKDYAPVQVALLKPAIVLLEKVMNLTANTLWTPAR
jgi:hypothetical protein